MKFSNHHIRIPFSLTKLLIFFFAVCIATSMWYAVVFQETMESEVVVFLNYRGLPKNLQVTDGLVYRVTERVRGPKMLMTTLPRSFDLPIDISGIKVGDDTSNIFSVIDEQKKYSNQSLRRAFKIVDVKPAVIRLHAEYIDHINIPLHFTYRSESDMIVVTRRVSHRSVELHGPENEIKKLKELTALPIDVSVDLLDVGKDLVVRDVPILIPLKDCPHVTVEPSSVKIEYEVKGERVDVERFYEVSLAVANAKMYTVSPETVLLRLKVPSNRQRDSDYLKELRVTALPPDLKPGESRKVPLNFTPPEGMEVRNASQMVIIYRLPDDGLKEHPHFPQDAISRKTSAKELKANESSQETPKRHLRKKWKESNESKAAETSQETPKRHLLKKWKENNEPKAAEETPKRQLQKKREEKNASKAAVKPKTSKEP